MPVHSGAACIVCCADDGSTRAYGACDGRASVVPKDVAGASATLGAPSRIRSAASWLQLVADETTLQSDRMHKPLIDAGGQTSQRHSGPFHGCRLTCACFNAICCCHVVLSASRIDAVCADSTSLSCWYLPKQPHSSVPQRCTMRSTCWCVQV